MLSIYEVFSVIAAGIGRNVRCLVFVLMFLLFLLHNLWAVCIIKQLRSVVIVDLHCLRRINIEKSPLACKFHNTSMILNSGDAWCGWSNPILHFRLVLNLLSIPNYCSLPICYNVMVWLAKSCYSVQIVDCASMLKGKIWLDLSDLCRLAALLFSGQGCLEIHSFSPRTSFPSESLWNSLRKFGCRWGFVFTFYIAMCANIELQYGRSKVIQDGIQINCVINLGRAEFTAKHTRTVQLPFFVKLISSRSFSRKIISSFSLLTLFLVFPIFWHSIILFYEVSRLVWRSR